MNWLKWITHARKIITYFRENHELIKSVGLTVLIILSLVLTWSLWTFKPSYPGLQDARTLKKQEVDAEDQMELSDVVYPTQIIYHKGDRLYGIEANDMLSKFHEQIKNAKFSFDPGVRAATPFDPRNFSSKDMKNNEYIEIIYPFGMPQEIYKEVFSFDAEISASKPQNVDRLFLYQGSENVEGYLVSYNPRKKQKINSTISLSSMVKDINGAIKDRKFVPYMYYDIEDPDDKQDLKHRFYFPKQPQELTRYTYISNAVTDDTYEKYKKVLFKDPLAVKSASDSNETTFTDSTSALVINQLENRFTYTNFADYNLNNATNSSPLFQSIDYINTHAGWGNPYILSNLSQNSAGFWLFVNNLPVLDKEMQMNLEWDDTELKTYERSMIQLDLENNSYPDDALQEKVTIESGEKVKQELIDKEYNDNYIQDIRIGFTMERQAQPHIYKLEPRWFINYVNKGWLPLFKDDREEGY
ncbi:YycH family regulatory protein [Fictibacillus barbaricus]|uniref:Regulatory protein YycH of two-component signal transduction system YycFG n=1 Tax=Fictibacillus barbaricus TaxID=182136 RepID=A0ABU1U3M5_9BACL|nr:two-component system activity regulator YycH [Fictibacillus barbaricus]MDR7074058.1 regulatory protein YycH of two-component signal transduction system YycFG [Fictibacillus barbaricus]